MQGANMPAFHGHCQTFCFFTVKKVEMVIEGKGYFCFHAGSNLPVTVSGLLYAIIISLLIKRSVIKRQKAAELSCRVDKPENEVLKKRADRQHRTVKMLFAAYIWYILCLVPAPVAVTYFSDEYRHLPVLQLLLRVLLLLGYVRYR